MIPKILHVSTAKTWRGGEQQLIYLVEELRLQNIEQVVVCTKGSCVEEYCRHNNIKVYTAKKLFPIDPAFASLIAGVVNKHSSNIVHTHDAHAHTFAVMAAAFFGIKASVVVSRRVDFPIRKGVLSKWKYNHSSLKRILCVSNAIKEITEKGVSNAEILSTVYSGIDLRRFDNPPADNVLRKEYELAEHTFLVGNVAALAPHKDYFTFLKVAEKAKNDKLDIKFFVIGAGELEEELKAYANKLQLTDYVIFTGFRDDIPQVIPSLDTFLISSKTEGLGTSILDALACKVPVVATEAGGIPEIIINNKTGLTAPVANAEALYLQLVKIVQNEALRKELVANASVHLQNFTKQATANKTLAVYKDILQSN